MKAKKVKQGCNLECKKKCGDKISDNERKNIHQSFWNLQNITEKRLFISKMVKLIPSARSRKRKDTKTGKRRMRGLTQKYFLQKAGNELVEVCQVFFFNTLDISKQMVSTAILKGLETGTIAPDMRGVNSKHNRLSDELVEQVVKHIRKFKTVPSHYCRQTSQREYLPQELNVAKMHRMYVLWCEKKSSNL